MSALSDLASALVAAICSFTLVNAAGCGTDAKGVDDCRNIEGARCEAAKSCNLGVTDVDACRRFYRDQCLHGLPVDSPGGPAVAACVSAIRAAGSTCVDPNNSDPVALESAKKLVQNPELAPDCSFLAPPAASGGSAGSSGADGGGTSGTSGSGGAAGATG